jgi:hypothetical protein
VDDNAEGGEVYYFFAGISDEGQNEVVLYPNIVSSGDLVSLRNASQAITSVSIYDVSGKSVAMYGEGIQQFITDFAAGSYTVVMQKNTPERLERARLIVR